MLARLRLVLAASFALTATAGTAVAQSADVAAPAAAAVADSIAPATAEMTAVVAGPTVAATAITVRPAATATLSADEASTAVVQTRSRRGGTLMIIGGAALLSGVLVGDDVGTALSLGGAIVGLYGLYLWLQ